MTLQFLLTALVVCLSPGTGVVYTLAIALGQGRRAAVAAAVGCTIGIVPHIAAATLGLAAILHTSAVLFTVIKSAGVAYLLFLAWQSLRADGVLAVHGNTRGQPVFAIIRRGALINILNPKLSIFFLALLPPFLSGRPETATVEMLFLGAIFMAITFVVFVVYGAFAAASRDWLLQSARAMRWLNRCFALVFAALAARLAFARA
jgi:threonine/homoserine/homoserine lactone efflux protein